MAFRLRAEVASKVGLYTELVFSISRLQTPRTCLRLIDIDEMVDYPVI